MSDLDAPLYSFNQGEVSKLAMGRIDVAKMRLAAEQQVNWLPFVVGPMMLRPGLQYIGEVLGNSQAKLLRFIFSKLDTALIELTANTMRVWVDEELVTRVAVSTVIGDPMFQGTGAWSTANTTAGASATIASGVCTLSCTPIGGLAQIMQTVTVAPADYGKEHGIRLVITDGPVTFRAGSAMGLSDLIAQTTLDTGTHCLTCAPSGNINLQIESIDSFAKTLTQVSIDPAGALELPTPWVASDLPNIRYDQSGDIIFIACYGHAQRKIERRGLHAWSVVLYKSSDGPFQAAAGIEANFTPGAYAGNTTLTSDRPYFQASHVGCLFQLFTNGQLYQTLLGNNNAFTPTIRVTGVGSQRNFSWVAAGTWTGTLTLQRSFDGPDSGFVDVASQSGNGTYSENTGGSSGTPDLDNQIVWYRVGFKGGNYASGAALVNFTYTGGGGFGICRVTGYNSPTSVDIEVLQPFSSLQATQDWLEADWSSVIGWPTSVCFHEGRLWWFGRDRIWGSASDDYTSYAVQDSQGNVLGDAGAILEAFGQGPVDIVNWGLSLTRLLCGREMSIASIRSSSFDEPLTPTNFSVKDCSTNGAARLSPIKVDKRGIFVQQSNRRVYELFFNGQVLDYDAHDLTRLNLDIGKPGFVDLDIQRQPDTLIHLVRGDGEVAVLLYDPEDEVECWWRVQTQGAVENVAVLPSATGIEDLVYYIVNRTIAGVTRRFIERFAPRDNCVGGAINQLADCHVVYQGAPVTTLSGLASLQGEAVTVWADGAAIGNAVVNSNGEIAMPDGQAHANIVAGLAYSAQFQSAKLAYASQTGTALTKKKRIRHLGLILFDTHYQGVSFGPDFSNLDGLPLVEDDATTAANTVWPEKDLSLIEFPGDWDVDARLCLQATAPYPAKIGAAVVDVEEVDG